MIEGTVSVELLAQMYATQLTTKGRSTCWTGTGSITASCGRSSGRARSGGAEPGAAHRRDRQDLRPPASGGCSHDWCICGGDYFQGLRG